MSGKDLWKEFAMPLMLMVLFVVALFGVYGLSNTFSKAPTIELISGSDIVTDQADVPITGVVKNTSKLSANGREVSVSADGGFSTVIPVSLGENNVELVAGDKNQAKTNVRIVREEVAKAITATNTGITSSDLADSGPVETFFGSFGLAALILSLVVYRRSVRGNTLQRA